MPNKRRFILYIGIPIVVLITLSIWLFVYFRPDVGQPAKTQQPVAKEPAITSSKLQDSISELLAGSTDNWKTCRNENYKFEIKYPPNWRERIPPDRTNPYALEPCSWFLFTDQYGYETEFRIRIPMPAHVDTIPSLQTLKDVIITPEDRYYIEGGFSCEFTNPCYLHFGLYNIFSLFIKEFKDEDMEKFQEFVRPTDVFPPGKGGSVLTLFDQDLRLVKKVISAFKSW
ncbi:MAG: hypothetical protein Q8R26_03155 [bacterium]|nr:hypothetical protein [bacterium]